MTTSDYMQAIARKAGIKFNTYALHKYMHARYGWSDSAVRNYIKNSHAPEDSRCLDIANELGIDPAIVIADVHLQYANSKKEQQVWKKISDYARHVAASLVVAAILAVSAPGFFIADQAHASVSNLTGLYIMRINPGFFFALIILLWYGSRSQDIESGSR